jgi:hypothetical protein
MMDFLFKKLMLNDEIEKKQDIYKKDVNPS